MRQRVRELLLTVSGTNRAILAMAPSEVSKQASLGGAILTTAALAAVSAAVALRMAVGAPWWMAVPIAVIWGVAILNIDRWIVVSTQRQSRWWWTVLAGLPRLALAIIIGVVVSTPLTLLLFNDEIEARLKVDQNTQLSKFDAQLGDDPRFSDLDTDQSQIRQLEADIADGAPADAVLNNPEVRALGAQLAQVETDYRQAELDVACEKEGTCGSGVPGAGIAAAEKIARRDRLATERDDLTARLAATRLEVQATVDAQTSTALRFQQQQLDELRDEVEADTAARADEATEHEAAVANNDGLLARLAAMDGLEETSSQLRTAHLLLFGFLTSLEALPALLKLVLLLGRPSLYERLQSKEEERVMDRVLQRHELEYDEAQHVLNSARDSAQIRASAQLDAESHAAKLVLKAQLELAEMAVAQWKAGQAARVAEDMDNWITTHLTEDHLGPTARL